jgi:hypothetical protein
MVSRNSRYLMTICIDSLYDYFNGNIYFLSKKYSFPSIFENLQLQILKMLFEAKNRLKYDNNSSFPSLLTGFKPANSQNREYQTRE